MSANQEWKDAYGELQAAVTALGFPAELAAAVSKNLGWPRAMRRMASYLRQARPSRPELVADEMLAIREEILTWQAKKASQAANMTYNVLLNEGLDGNGRD